MNASIRHALAAIGLTACTTTIIEAPPPAAGTESTPEPTPTPTPDLPTPDSGSTSTGSTSSSSGETPTGTMTGSSTGGGSTGSSGEPTTPWGQCVDASIGAPTCDQVCASESSACRPNVCDGVAFVFYGNLGECDHNALPTDGIGGCADVLPADRWVRCCCD